MGNIQAFEDATGQMSPEQVDAENIRIIINEWNRGPDVTDIPRRAILAGQIKVISYQPGPIKLHGGSTLANGSYSSLVLNFDNNGLTSAAGQTFMPTFLVDLFVDPSDTSSTSAMYASGYAYPDGTHVTSAMQNLTFTWYLRNSTPGTTQDVVSYVLAIRNQDSSPHAYWVSCQLLMPADGNLNEGNTAVYLP